ncbi:hypothetical protein HPULCUR_002215 [Helicostylum pulchrum]|uniref:Uncharacterized protein n=1 Tax=Helicostylum pulchrum TaxID=562976 RepID=A0ABP9XRZ2_9FUNG
MSQEEIERSEARQVNLQLEYCKLQEQDTIFTDGLDGSVGSRIKNEALKIYSNFSDVYVKEQTCISLGMNSILDLSYSFGDAQSTLFIETLWSDLKRKFPVEEEDAETDENLTGITHDFMLTVESLVKTKNSFQVKLEKLSNWLKRVKSDKKKLIKMNRTLFI